MCLEFFDEDESLRLLQCNMHRTRRNDKSETSETTVVWALAGLGLAQKSLWEVAEPLARGALVTVLIDFKPDPATFFAIHPVSRSQSRKIGLFVEELARFLAPNLV